MLCLGRVLIYLSKLRFYRQMRYLAWLFHYAKKEVVVFRSSPNTPVNDMQNCFFTKTKKGAAAGKSNTQNKRAVLEMQ